MRDVLCECVEILGRDCALCWANVDMHAMKEKHFLITAEINILNIEENEVKSALHVYLIIDVEY